MATRRQRQRVAVESEGGVAMAEHATAETEDNEPEGDESEDEDSARQAWQAGQQQARQAQQERQTKAQEASACAAKFQEQQRDRVHAPSIAESGMQPWDGVSVEVAQLDESKVRCAPLPRALNSGLLAFNFTT